VTHRVADDWRETGVAQHNLRLGVGQDVGHLMTRKGAEGVQARYCGQHHPSTRVVRASLATKCVLTFTTTPRTAAAAKCASTTAPQLGRMTACRNARCVAGRCSTGGAVSAMQGRRRHAPCGRQGAGHRSWT
jgi:hypothetical protein